jgi:effector-binding domain-containing protein
MAWIEKPKYQVIRKSGHFELRHYPSFNVAEIELSRSSDLNSGFQEIFNYISGDNKSGSKISMTSPVINVMKENTMSTAFVMPSAFSLETLPVPKDGRVKVMRKEAGTYAVIRFSGTWSASKFDRMSMRLKEWIRLNQWTLNSDLLIARYNPPFTPAFMRRNELMYEILM